MLNQKRRLKKLKRVIRVVLYRLPDKYFVFFQYFLTTGRVLRFWHPRRYTEKIQLYKLLYRKELVTICSDKYLVRSYVESAGYGRILNCLYAVWDSYKDITFESLPEQFALKATHASGTNYFVKNINNEDLVKIKCLAESWLKKDMFVSGREWGYKNIKPRIIAEKLLPRNHRGDLPDYKFFCFEGEVFCLYCMIDYADDKTQGKLGFFDRNFNRLHVYRKDYKPLVEKVEKPKNFDFMVEVAENLSKGFPHVRVDLYNIDGEVVFGEMTFYTSSGYMLFDPDDFDFVMGEYFNIIC